MGKLISIVLIILSQGVLANQIDEAVVIEVRKKIKLHKTENVYSDYFINAGTHHGLDVGAVVSVVRRVPVHDPFQNASIGDFRIRVADVEIIHADYKKSIARLLSIDRRRERPMVRYDSVMVGDRLDLHTIRSKQSVSQTPKTLPVDLQRAPAQVMKGEKKMAKSLPNKL